MVAPAPQPTIDPEALIRQLDPDEIRRKLADLSRERKALLALLRVALAARPDDQRGRKRSEEVR